MEENKNAEENVVPQEVPQQTDQQFEQQSNQQPEQQLNEQPQQEKKPPLMPGQEHEDELDYVGGALVTLIKNGFEKVKNLLAAKKVE